MYKLFWGKFLNSILISFELWTTCENFPFVHFLKHIYAKTVHCSRLRQPWELAAWIFCCEGASFWIHHHVHTQAIIPGAAPISGQWESRAEKRVPTHSCKRQESLNGLPWTWPKLSQSCTVAWESSSLTFLPFLSPFLGIRPTLGSKDSPCLLPPLSAPKNLSTCFPKQLTHKHWPFKVLWQPGILLAWSLFSSGKRQTINKMTNPWLRWFSDSN